MEEFQRHAKQFYPVKILVTGANGQLGREFRELARLNGKNEWVFVGRQQLDLSDPESIQKTINKTKPDIVFNAGAYTAVDKAEEETKLAHQINGEAMKVLSDLAAELGFFLIHYSTDYVFHGELTEPWKEMDARQPKGIYAKSKMAGEEHVVNSNARSLVIRTSWVFSSYGNNFVKTMLRLGKQKESLRVVSDQIGCPTYAKDLAAVSLQLIDRLEDLDGIEVLHFCNSGATNWAEFAQRIMEMAELKCAVSPIPSSEYPTAAERPPYSVLNCEKIEKITGQAIRSWDNALRDCLELINDNSMLENIDSEVLLNICELAGDEIMDVYESEEFDVELKGDDSPLTQADKRANDVIVANLELHYPDIPILSEETKAAEYEVRKEWDFFWLVDPLDGTKEFIKRNGEFTVNIALINKGRVVAGYIYVPATREFYYAKKGGGAFHRKREETEATKLLRSDVSGDSIRVAASRSHLNEATSAFVEELKRKYKEVELVAAGSSLKLCLIAKNVIDVYPRLAPTMEWDTGAGQIVVEEAGGKVLQHEKGESVEYNKEDLLNPYFVASVQNY